MWNSSKVKFKMEHYLRAIRELAIIGQLGVHQPHVEQATKVVLA